MALDADTAGLPARLHEHGESALFSGAPERDRERFAARLPASARPADRSPEVRTDGPVPVRIHRPEQPSGALAVFVHRGGRARGGGDVYDGVAARLAVDSEAGVASRLREHPTLTHGFLGLTAVVPAVDVAVAALHEDLAALLA